MGYTYTVCSVSLENPNTNTHKRQSKITTLLSLVLRLIKLSAVRDPFSLWASDKSHHE